MRASIALGALTVGASLLLGCVVVPDEERCEAACAVASHCGLLPSALGGNVGASRDANREDCVAHCRASDEGSLQVGGLLDVLAAQSPGSGALCTNGGIDDCVELIETLEDTASTSELRVTTELTVQMVSAVSHASLFDIEELCCFEERAEEGQRVIEAVYPMIGPTAQCLFELAVEVDAAILALRPPMTPENPMGDPDPMAADEACMALRSLALPPPSMSEETPCEFARKISRFHAIGLPMGDDACPIEDIAELESLRRELIELRRDWSLEAGGLLVEEEVEGVAEPPAPVVRPVDVIAEMVLAEIDDEIERPMSFLEEACRGYDCSADVDATPACAGGPFCSAADCLAAADACDPSLCDAELTPPGRDCSFFGIDTVTLGYRTEQGLEVFGEPLSGCPSQVELSTTFEDVKIGRVVPIAVVSGTLATNFYPEYLSLVGDRSFSWFLEGTPRWISGGSAVLELPSPLLQFLQEQYGDPLEFLGWLPHRLPVGQACDSQPMLCEAFYNDNCEDGLDNDGDGLVDEANAWCNLLMDDLAEACVVVGPGRAPPVQCGMPSGE